MMKRKKFIKFHFNRKILIFITLSTKLSFCLTFLEARLNKIRQDHLPTSPTDTNFILHPGFAFTDRGERFLLYDTNDVQVPYASAPTKVGRLIIFTSDSQLSILSQSKYIGSDGTFETAAQISQQNYIIMAEIEEKHPGKNKL
jgi:hypothetical protein